ncbi:hypothetical protein BDN67DRAFT_1015038 [Paxillus ammoniavirescens]|nr:hypothetical protein BDN67DRAFT_1015038 [Paxillus ammoniavirescens]
MEIQPIDNSLFCMILDKLDQFDISQSSRSRAGIGQQSWISDPLPWHMAILAGHW